MAYYYNNQNVVFTDQIQIAHEPPRPPGLPLQFVQKPLSSPGCPAGLEYLLQIDQLQINQVPSLLEAFADWETNNKYEINNAAGQRVYLAAEKTDSFMRVCCKSRRGFFIHIIDNFNNEVMKVTREFNCCAGCCWCAGSCDVCAHEVFIEAPVGTVVGIVRQTGSFWKAKYDILDQNRECLLKIEGPCCIFDGACCNCDNEFRVLTSDGSNQIGKIAKQYAGFVKEAFTNADKFLITFPSDLSVKTKATLIGAVFLIDFMFFEQRQNNNNNNNHHK